MSVHRNAALSLVKRRELVEYIAAGATLKAAGERFGVSGTTVRRWWRRYRVEGVAGLEDRSSRPKRMPRAIKEEVRQKVLELRKQRRTIRSIAAKLGISKTSVARIVKAAGLSRLRALDPPEPDNRYEHARPGDMLHVDIKKLARFHVPGHRVTHNRAGGRSPGAGFDYAVVGLDDHSRLAMVGIYPDETAHSVADFLDRVLTAMSRLGAPVRVVLTDNGRAFTSRAAREVYQRHNVRHRTTRPYRPRTNGKAERFIQTMLREWAYAASYASSDERNAALGPWLKWYNEQRPHTSLQGQPPISRLRNLGGLDTGQRRLARQRHT